MSQPNAAKKPNPVSAGTGDTRINHAGNGSDARAAASAASRDGDTERSPRDPNPPADRAPGGPTTPTNMRAEIEQRRPSTSARCASLRAALRGMMWPAASSSCGASQSAPNVVIGCARRQLRARAASRRSRIWSWLRCAPSAWR